MGSAAEVTAETREGSAKITRKELIKHEQNPESTSVMSSTRGES